MAECRDFFDDSTVGHSRSSSIAINTPGHGKEDVDPHCLDLTLGLSNFSGSSPSPPHQQGDLVRAVSSFPFLQRHPSGNFASSLPATASPPQTPPVQSDGLKLPSGQHDVGPAIGRQRSAGEQCTSLSPFGSQTDAALPVKALLPASNGALPSRDQIWQTLQKSSTLFQHAQQSDGASHMWNRRAASMQVVLPRNGLDDLEHSQIRRSCSNGVLARALSQQLSNVESSRDCILEESIRPSQHPLQEELEDLKKRKEMQAQRRLEARKRRKILLEEKQFKSCRHGSGLVRHGSKQISSPSDKFSQVGAPVAEDDAVPESLCISPDDSKSVGSDDIKQGPCKMYKEERRQDLTEVGKNNIQVEEEEHVYQGMHSGGGKLNIFVDAYSKHRGPAVKGTRNFLSNEHDSGIHGSMTSTVLEQLSGGKYNDQKRTPVTIIANQMGTPVFTVEGRRSTLINEADCMINSVPGDAVKEAGGVRGNHSSSFSSSHTDSASLLFSLKQNAYFAGGAAVSATPNQPVYPFPYFMQCPVAGNGDNDSSIQSLPNVPAGSCSPATKTFTGLAFSPSSGIFLQRSGSINRDFVGDSEGKQGSSERSTFYPLPRTSSNSKHLSEEAQHSGSRLEFQVSLPASQLSSASNITSDASHCKNLRVERQPSRPLGGRLLSQNSCVEDSAFSCSWQEKTSPGQCGVSLPFEAPPLRLGKSNLRPEEGAKQDEGSSESQLASEHSGLDAFYAQLTVIDKQKSASFSDLPWVTTTGKGPNGKTITGVLYVADGRQVRLVCSCHGRHMSAVEFVEHSGSSDLSNPERNIVVSSYHPHLNYQLASTAV